MKTQLIHAVTRVFERHFNNKEHLMVDMHYSDTERTEDLEITEKSTDIE